MTYEKLKGYPLITEKEITWGLEAAVRQVKSCLPGFTSSFKHIFTTGQFYAEAENNQWTNGFWTGQLWLAYEYTREERLKEAALCQVDSFRYRARHRIETDTHDLGFLYTPSCVAAYKLTGSQKARDTAVLAADMLLERFHEKGQFIQAWGKLNEPGNYRLIIDCLLNLPLLYWASQVTGDETYAQKAQAHVHTALSVLIRPDGSAYHTFYFDPATGEPLKGVTHQGYSADSAWARGQAWGIYGLALSYRYTKKPEYAELFHKVIQYFMEHLPEDLIPYWDFIFTDGSMEPRDSSAAAIAACGLLEMAGLVPEQMGKQYRKYAKQLMKVLWDRCAAKDPSVSHGLLLHGVYGRKSPCNDCIDHGIDECNLWGDYYYLEGLIRLWKDWNSYW